MAAPRQFSIALSFQRPEGERVRHGHFACSYGQTASGAVAIQALALSTVARRFRAVRRERGAYAIYVDDEPRPRGKGPQLAPERCAVSSKASSTWARCAAAPSATMYGTRPPPAR